MSQDWGHQKYYNLLVPFMLFFHMQVCLWFLIKIQPVNYLERFILKNWSCQSVAYWLILAQPFTV